MERQVRTDEMEVQTTFTTSLRKEAASERETFAADLPSFDRFEALTEKLLKVPKEEVDEKRAEWEEARKHKQD
jgi:hypothetical protein